MTNAALQLAGQSETQGQPPTALPAKGKANCPTCRGDGYAWVMDMKTLQREIGDCPTCKPKRPELPANSHRLNTFPGGRPLRSGWHTKS